MPKKPKGKSIPTKIILVFKFRDLIFFNFNTRILLVGMLLPLGFLGSFLLNNFLKETYSSRKLELEESLENLLDKNVDLGDYVGIRFLGFSLGNSKINDKKDIDSEIKAKNVYVGIMPFRSFLKQKWIVKISPKEAAINVDGDFFKRDESLSLIHI